LPEKLPENAPEKDTYYRQTTSTFSPTPKNRFRPPVFNIAVILNRKTRPFPCTARRRFHAPIPRRAGPPENSYTSLQSSGRCLAKLVD